MKKHQRFLTVACVVIIVASLNGCAGFGVVPPQFEGQERPYYGRVGLVAARFQPQIKVDVLTSGKGAGAAKGAGGGALEAARCWLLAPFCLPVGIILGGIAGSSSMESSERIAATADTMKVQLDYFKMQGFSVEKAAEYAREVELPEFSILKDQGPEDLNALPMYRPASGEHLDTVLELSVISFEAEITGKKKDFIRIKMEFRARLINASDGKIMDSLTHQLLDLVPYAGPSKDNYQMLTAVIMSNYRNFAEIALDELLLVYRPTKIDLEAINQKVKKTDPLSQSRDRLTDDVLRPLYPEVNMYQEPSIVDSIEPTFQWEALPRLKDFNEAVAKSKITDLKYDLEIFGPFTTGENIYKVTGLTEPKFKLSGIFKPCTSYRWSVRARFMLNGNRQVTEWLGRYGYFQVSPWRWRRDAYQPLTPNMHSSKMYHFSKIYYLSFRTPVASPAGKCP
jgi:hypothetical protein